MTLFRVLRAVVLPITLCGFVWGDGTTSDDGRSAPKPIPASELSEPLHKSEQYKRLLETFEGAEEDGSFPHPATFTLWDMSDHDAEWAEMLESGRYTVPLELIPWQKLVLSPNGRAEICKLRRSIFPICRMGRYRVRGIMAHVVVHGLDLDSDLTLEEIFLFLRPKDTKHPYVLGNIYYVDRYRISTHHTAGTL